MIKMPTTKDIILAYIETRKGGATYADMIHTLRLHRATLRRWAMELERDGSVERSREHSKARAIFKATQGKQDEESNNDLS